MIPKSIYALILPFGIMPPLVLIIRALWISGTYLSETLVMHLEETVCLSSA